MKHWYTILLALARDPLLSERQLAWVTGLSGIQVKRTLRGLAREGMVEGMQLEEPGFPAVDLYLLTRSGLTWLAREAGISTEECARKVGLTSEKVRHLILLAGRAFQARNLMAALPTAGVELVGWQTLPKVKGVVLDGTALVRCNGAYLGVVVELDCRTRVRERVKVLQALRADLGCPPGSPVVVALCWEAEQADHFLELLRREALRARGPMVSAYISLGSELLKHGVAAPIWYSTDLRGKSHLFQGVQGETSATTGPPPVPPASDWQGDRGIERMRRLTGAPALGILERDSGHISILMLDPPTCEGGQWPRPQTAVHHPPGWLQDESRGTTTVLQAPLCRLRHQFQEARGKGARWQDLCGFCLVSSSLEKRLLEEIDAHPLLSAAELAALSALDMGQVERALAALEGWGMVVRYLAREGKLFRLEAAPLPQRGEVRYTCSARGLAVIAARRLWGQAVTGYARSRHWGLTPRGELNTGTLISHFKHTRGVIDFFISLATSAREAGNQELLSWAMERDAMVFYYVGEKLHRLIPDGRGRYRIGKDVYPFFLEYERKRKMRWRLKRKLYCYYAFWLSGEHRLREIRMPLLLVVTTGMRRAETVIGVARDIAGELGSDVLPIRVTSQRLVSEEGPCSPIWRAPQTEGWQYCFPGLRGS